jgi:hypothetical protein
MNCEIDVAHWQGCYGLTRADDLPGATENDIEFAFQQRECLFKVVTVRRRASTGRNVHVDQTELARGVSSGEKNRIRVSDYADVRALAVVVGICNCECAF